MWSIVRTKPRREKWASQNLDIQGIENYFPSMKQTRVHRGKIIFYDVPVFPSYLFVFVSAGSGDWRRISSTFGVSRFLTVGGEPVKVSCDIIDELKNRADYAAVATRFHIGQRLRAIEGVMQGRVCICEGMTASDRVMVLFNAIGFDFRTEMFVKDLEAISL